MPVDPVVQEIVDGMRAAPGPAMHEMTPQEARAQVDEQTSFMNGPEVAIEDRTLPGSHGELPIRIYRPGADGPLPVVVFFHGGGFVVGGLSSHDAACRSLCYKSGLVVVAVDYRLAPEHPFPAAPEDAYTATRWISEHGAELGIDSARLAVAGDSAGGNLSAVVSLMAKERGGPPIALQVLIYPVTDYAETQSRRDNAGYMPRPEEITWFDDQYCKQSDRTHPWSAPLRAPDLSGLPPALVITAEYDPLRDEGEAYGQRLQEAGVPATVVRYDGMIHGFFQMTAFLPQAVDAEDQVVEALRAALL